MPNVQPILQRESQPGDDSDDARQAPRDAWPAAPPEAQGCFPEACEEIIAGFVDPCPQVFATYSYEVAFNQLRWGRGVTISIFAVPLLVAGIALVSRYLLRERAA